jgi:hypothetical protein
MGNILTAQVSIEGTRPILWHKFGPESLPLEKQERTGVAGNDPEEWRKTVLCTKEGQLYIRPDYVFSCLREAARYTKKGRGSIQKYVAATLQVSPDRLLFDRHIPGFDGGLPEEMPTDDTLPVYLDIRGVRNPSTRARNVRYRVAASTGWHMAFTLMWDCTVASRNQLEAVTIDGGKLVGLGDGRSIGFGRFDVLEFAVSE